jgi:hypothetical protein
MERVSYLLRCKLLKYSHVLPGSPYSCCVLQEGFSLVRMREDRPWSCVGSHLRLEQERRSLYEQIHRGGRCGGCHCQVGRGGCECRYLRVSSRSSRLAMP